MAGATSPLVSVIIPTLNSARYIERSLRSALGQTHARIEILVIDGGSTDGTLDLVQALADSRVRQCVYRDTPGQGAARNYGIRISSGDIITFLDSDDMYLPTKIERQVAWLSSHPEHAVVYCRTKFFFAGRPETFYRSRVAPASGNVLAALLKTSLVNPNTIMLRREVLQRVGLFNETRHYPEEWDLCLRIALAGYDFGFVDETLVVVENRPDSITTIQIQPILKQHACEMFERLFGDGVEVGNVVYDARPTIRSLRMKFAVACLMNGRRREFLETFCRFAPMPNGFRLIVGILLAATPPLLVRQLWAWNHRRHSALVVG